MVREDIVVDVGGGWQPPLIPGLKRGWTGGRLEEFEGEDQAVLMNPLNRQELRKESAPRGNDVVLDEARSAARGALTVGLL